MSDGVFDEQALGVKMEVQPGWTIEKGINDYSKGKMAPGQLVRYRFLHRLLCLRF